jgi:hypothetical protein
MTNELVTICYRRGCDQIVDGAPGPRYCREHAAERVTELRRELKVLQDAYGDDAKPSKRQHEG